VNSKTGSYIHRLDEHEDGPFNRVVVCVSYSPDGKRIVSGEEDRTVNVWDAETGRQTFTLRGHLGAVNSVSFSPDGKWIASGSWDNTLKVWDAQTGQKTLTLKGHSEAVTSVSFSPDGKRIVSGSEDKTVKVWDAQTGAGVFVTGLTVENVVAVGTSQSLGMITAIDPWTIFGF